jgi:hypothetical protein
MSSVILMNGLFFLCILLHCYARGKFHDYQFLERDAYGDWAQRQFASYTEAEKRMNNANKAWHRWLWLMIVTLFIGFFFLINASYHGQLKTQSFCMILIGAAIYAVAIDPLIAIIALEKGFFYTGNEAVLKRRRFDWHDGKTSFIARFIILISTIILSITI